MLQVSEQEIENRLRLDNPWWEAGAGIDADYRQFPRRAYLSAFSSLIREKTVNRALVLLGPRRVGKTILVYHVIQDFLDQYGISGRDILYLSLETPIYTGLTLESLVQRFQRLFKRPENTHLYVFFDEIQYLKDWETHLKSLVDRYRGVRFVATGSAAAELKKRGTESGAGRFTDFVLPPLTFAEYLRFIKREEELIVATDDGRGRLSYGTQEIFRLNDVFIDYLNFGGYPEAVFSDVVRKNPRRYIKSDIIDKVLLRDLPILYGISDIQELNSLFNTLAYNTGQELSMENLSKTSHVAKNTLAKYLDYLEAAFLIKRIRRVDQDAKRFQRATAFKIYLTNPTMRAALFGPVDTNHVAMGALVETAVFSQWMHNEFFVGSLHYARWKQGEVDLVSIDQTKQRPRFVVEVKWSDLPLSDKREIKGILAFSKKHELTRMPLVTTLSKQDIKNIDGTFVEFTPSCLHCYTVAKNTLEKSKL